MAARLVEPSASVIISLPCAFVISNIFSVSFVCLSPINSINFDDSKASVVTPKSCLETSIVSALVLNILAVAAITFDPKSTALWTTIL